MSESNGKPHPRFSLLGPDGKPVSSGGGVVGPDGQPAARSIEPGQHAAVALIKAAAHGPDFQEVLDDVEGWRERNAGALAAGQRVTIHGVQMAARWQREAREFLEKAVASIEREQEKTHATRLEKLEEGGPDGPEG